MCEALCSNLVSPKYIKKKKKETVPYTGCFLEQRIAVNQSTASVHVCHSQNFMTFLFGCGGGIGV
jgi:hypothetical protein